MAAITSGGLNFKASTKGLSRTWKVEKVHEGSYTGGKVALSNEFKLEEEKETSTFVAAACGGGVAILDISSGSVLHKLQHKVDVCHMLCEFW